MGPGFESPKAHQSLKYGRASKREKREWPVGQAVKTPASHAGNGSSILPRVTKPQIKIEYVVGEYCGEGPPVPIPNTEVKLTSAENTCLATDWEDRSMPTQRTGVHYELRFFPFSLRYISLSMQQ